VGSFLDERESEMFRKAGVSRVKLQSIVLCPSDAYFLALDGNTSFRVTVGSKENVFNFDHCCQQNSDKLDVFEEVAMKLQISISMAMLGYDSAIFLYCAKVSADELNATVRMLHTLAIAKLYSRSKSDETSNTTVDSISISAFELLDSQLKDLCNDNGYDLKVRDGGANNIYIEGLSEHEGITSEHFSSIFENILLNRTYLVSGLQSETGARSSSTDGSALSTKIIGEVGTMVIQFKIKQSIKLPYDCGYTKREVILHVITLAPSDLLSSALELKGPKALASLRALNTVVKVDSIAGNKKNCKIGKKNIDWLIGNAQTTLNNQLRNALKALTTLTRVVHALALKSNNSSHIMNTKDELHDDDGIDGGSAVKVHIPFRDSLLTRFLRSSLEGNCFASMLTIPSSVDAEAASRALRFAAEMSKLYNIVWIKEELVLTSQQTAATAESSSSSVAAVHIHSQHSSNNPYDHFHSLQSSMHEELSKLAVELDALEQMRFVALAQMHIDIQSQENRSSSASSIATMLGTKSIAENDSNNEVKAGAESKDKIQAKNSSGVSGSNALLPTKIKSPEKATSFPPSPSSPSTLVKADTSPDKQLFQLPKQLPPCPDLLPPAGKSSSRRLGRKLSSNSVNKNRGVIKSRLNRNAMMQIPLEPIRSKTASSSNSNCLRSYEEKGSGVSDVAVYKSRMQGASTSRSEKRSANSISSSSSSGHDNGGSNDRSLRSYGLRDQSRKTAVITSLPILASSSIQKSGDSNPITALDVRMSLPPLISSAIEAGSLLGHEGESAIGLEETIEAAQLPRDEASNINIQIPAADSSDESNRSSESLLLDPSERSQLLLFKLKVSTFNHDRNRGTSDSIIQQNCADMSTLLHPVLPVEAKKSDHSLRAQQRMSDLESSADDHDENDEGDGLTSLERSFLRNVSTNLVVAAKKDLHHGVNVQVKNSFERSPHPPRRGQYPHLLVYCL
jgi:hypothetical protein